MMFLTEWIDERINYGDISYFNYNEFSNIETLSWTTIAKMENRSIVALKILKNSKINESDFKEFITKLKALRMVYFHPTINRFFGITKDSNTYFSVCEYANEGNLRHYLKNEFSKLQWNDKIRMALDITRGLMCLHSKKIIHGDLHAHNILVHGGRLMIAEFGLFKQVEEAASNIVYVDPQYLHNSSYKRDMKSDIYSLGILLWELSSGHPPFSNYEEAQIASEIVNGKREDLVENTPLEYLQLYQKCWQYNPNLRPEINEVYGILSQLKLQFNTNKQINTKATYDESSSNFMDFDYNEMPDQSSIRTAYNENSMDIDYNEILDQLSSRAAYDDSFMDFDFNEISSPHTTKIRTEIFGILTDKQIVRKFKLNHGLILAEYDIRPSVQPIIAENGKLEMGSYEGPPIVYTYINAHKSDVCINFPVVEISYNGNFNLAGEPGGPLFNNEVLYGHFLARKFLAGGQLFIKNLAKRTKVEIDVLKFHLFCAYYLVKYSIEIQFSSLFTLELSPKIETLNGETLNTHEKLVNWMNNLYRRNMIDIISYESLIPIALLRHSVSSIDYLETFDEKQPGMANFIEKLSLVEWVGDAIDNNLMSLVEEFQLFRGLIVNKNYKMENSKKIAINLISEVPRASLRDESYLELIGPSTKSENFLITNKIFSIKNLITFPFVKSDLKSYGGYHHVLVKFERYQIQLNRHYIEPTKEFERGIEEALNSMKPLNALQDIFNEYGHLFPLRIILGRSLKNILPITYSAYERINLKSPIFESLNPHLNDLNISYFLTKKCEIIENDDLANWIQKTNNNLEIIEFDDIIPLYKIFRIEQQEKIDDILYNDNPRVIMTGITDLEDLNNNNVEHYKRINIEPSLEDKTYEVFGSIISKNNSKLKEFYVSFGLYDINGFYAIIKRLGETAIDITKCRIFWMIIGNPLKLSVLSPNSRDVRVECFKKSILLQHDQLIYDIKDLPKSPQRDDTMVFNVRSENYGLINSIKLMGWTCRYNSIRIVVENDIKQIFYDDDNTSENIEIDICILSSNYANLKIDHTKEEYPFKLIGEALTEDKEEEKKEGEEEYEEYEDEKDEDEEESLSKSALKIRNIESTRVTRFNKEVDESIIKHMNELKHLPHHPYSEISKLISKHHQYYSPKRIRQRWINHLDPTLCHKPLTEDEKLFINEWVSTNRIDGKIGWKNLTTEMEHAFNEKHSQNKLKNFWYSKKRQVARNEHKESDNGISHKENNNEENNNGLLLGQFFGCLWD